MSAPAPLPARAPQNPRTRPSTVLERGDGGPRPGCGAQCPGGSSRGRRASLSPSNRRPVSALEISFTLFLRTTSLAHAFGFFLILTHSCAGSMPVGPKDCAISRHTMRRLLREGGIFFEPGISPCPLLSSSARARPRAARTSLDSTKQLLAHHTLKLKDPATGGAFRAAVERSWRGTAGDALVPGTSARVAADREPRARALHGKPPPAVSVWR